MKPIITYILESMEELYHFTNAGNLINIIKKDEWIPSVENDGEIYISTTRTKYAGIGYPTQMVDDGNVVRIVFDGRKLNSKFKIKPVDKMKGKWMAIKKNWDMPDTYDQNKKEILKQGNVESEDRVYIHTESIPDIHKFIKSIHVNLENLDEKYLPKIQVYCKRFNIELKEYENTKKFNFRS